KNLAAIPSQRKAGRNPWTRIELRFVEHLVGSSCQDRAVRNAVLLRSQEIIGEEPAAEIGIKNSGIEKLDAVGGRRNVVSRQGLIDDYRDKERGEQIRAFRRSAKLTARPPVGRRVPTVGVRLLSCDHERETQSIGDRVPAIIV